MEIMKWFLLLIIYSFVGWVYESTLCSVTGHKLVNRGFLHGPICPVYGFGALTILIVLYGRTDDIAELFFAGMVLTTIVEYFTAWLLDRLFHKKWWDYSDHHFNIQGRICLIGAIAFGSMAVALVRYIHPFIDNYMMMISYQTMLTSSVVLFIILIIDLTTTVRNLLIESGKQEQMETVLKGFLKQNSERANDIKAKLLELYR